LALTELLEAYANKWVWAWRWKRAAKKFYAEVERLEKALSMSESIREVAEVRHGDELDEAYRKGYEEAVRCEKKLRRTIDWEPRQ
jgi:hypothetical protein